jgi:YgiT-type zinc finger domain-containing protein
MQCPLCGNYTIEEKRGEFRFEPPPNIPGGTIIIADATWQECSQCGEIILSHELDQSIERVADVRKES